MFVVLTEFASVDESFVTGSYLFSCSRLSLLDCLQGLFTTFINPVMLTVTSRLEVKGNVVSAHAVRTYGGVKV